MVFCQQVLLILLVSFLFLYLPLASWDIYLTRQPLICSLAGWFEPGKVTHAFKPNSEQAEAVDLRESEVGWGTLWAPGQPAMHIYSLKNKLK